MCNKIKNFFANILLFLKKSLSFNLNVTKPRIIISVILSISSVIICTLLKAPIFWTVIFALLYGSVCLIKIEFKSQRLLFPALACGAFLIFALPQLLLFWPNVLGAFWGIPILVILLNLIVGIFLIALFYTFVLHPGIAFAVPSFIMLLLATISYYVNSFRGSEFLVADILSIPTAMSVVGQYKLVFKSEFTVLWLLLILICIILIADTKYTFKKRKILHRLVSFSIFVSCALVIVVSANFVPSYHFHLDGSDRNGFVLNFPLSIRDLIVDKPDGYHKYDYSNIESIKTEDVERKPDIIIIMDEAFSDLRVINASLNTNKPVMPFFDSLKEDTVKGYALSSIFGGGTANSEYESLTGNTLAFLPNGSSAYQQYVKDDVFSLVNYFNKMEYRTLALHPYPGINWQRNRVWEQMGFDELYFDKEFPPKEDTYYIRYYMSDTSMFDFMLKALSETQKNKPTFMFGVTMQNHGGYSDPMKENIKLNGYSKEYPKAEQYLSLLNETDRALEYFISELKKSDRETVVLFFGDHQAVIENEFYEELHGGKFETLEEEQLKYKVPFLIWANYDIEEKEVPLTSLNYLSNLLFETANIPLSPYQQFLSKLSEKIPAINSNGYYSAADKCYKTLDEATGDEYDLLNEYHILQYNNMFDKKNKSKIFEQ